MSSSYLKKSLNANYDPVLYMSPSYTQDFTVSLRRAVLRVRDDDDMDVSYVTVQSTLKDANLNLIM